MFVLDTNAVIHFFKNKGRVAERLLATSPGEIALPTAHNTAEFRRIESLRIDDWYL